MSRRAGAAIALGLCVAFASGWHAWRGAVGEPAAHLGDDWHRGHRIVDRHGELLRELPSAIGSRGAPLGLGAMGDRLVMATLVSEDRRFYEHSGVDLQAIVRALGQNVAELRLVSGASTITQQLVKLLDTEGMPTREGRTMAVKLRESARAQNLEAELSKREILEAYLNRLNYGQGYVGPEAAALGYFGKSPAELSWAQAALLAVLPRAPSFLDPHQHVERATLRQQKLLDALFEADVIDATERDRAKGEAIALLKVARPFEAPHLTEAMRAGAHGGLSAGDVTRTTIDLALQRDIEGLVEVHRMRLQDKHASGAAVMVIDNHTGEVLGYVGSGGWTDADSGQIDMVRARRQPGSTLKPFVYGLAFERGMQPSEMLADVATRFGETRGEYAPSNFSGGFVGPVSAREALAGSLNVPAVRIASSLGDGVLLERLHALGFDSLERDAAHYGLSLALGSGEVTLAELARSYVTLARGGEQIALRFTLSDAPVEATRVMPVTVAAAISDALSDPLARVRGLGGSGPFDIGMAVKTGTSSGYRDTYALGYTRERTVAVWVGNPDGERTRELTGGSGAGPLFADVMRLAMKDVTQRRALFDAEILPPIEVCPLSGLPAGDACPDRVMRRHIPHEHASEGHCTLHRHATRAASKWRCDARGRDTVVLLPEVFAPWLRSQPVGAPGRDPAGLPWLSASDTMGCDVAPALAELRIDDPVAGTVLVASRAGSVELAASVIGSAPFEVEYVLDGQVVARVGPPYRALVAATAGDHVLVARPADPHAAVRLAESRFSVR